MERGRHAARRGAQAKKARISGALDFALRAAEECLRASPVIRTRRTMIRI